MVHIVAIHGAYRVNGVTDQVIAAMADELHSRGAGVEIVPLREKNIHYCVNCRACMQAAGTMPGGCVQHDDMAQLVEAMEAADGFIFASPTTMGSATALFKTFLERLAVYGHWPWGAVAPRERKAGLRRKPAVLASSSAAPAFLARWVYSTHGQLAYAARLVGAEVCAACLLGPLSQKTPFLLPQPLAAKARKAARALL